MPGFAHHVFISYTHADNQVPDKGQKGFVSMLFRALKIRLDQIFDDESARVWFDKKQRGNEPLKEGIAKKLRESAFLLAVVSPPYLHSQWCKDELATFLLAAAEADGLDIEEKRRIFKVIKTHVPLDKQPAALKALCGYKFYRENPESGRYRDFFMGFGASVDPEFWERLDDLAYDIRDSLYRLIAKRKEGDPSTPKAVVFLAETTSDLDPERNRIRRELLARNCKVLPETPLPLTRQKLEDGVRDHLHHSDFAIHFVGKHVGIVPEGQDQSIVQIQYALASEHNARNDGFSQWIWLPAGLNVQEKRQKEWIERLRTEPR